MLIDIMIICALTVAAPYYDCDATPWTIYWYDDKYLDSIRNDWGDKICPTKGVRIVGCALYLLVPRVDVMNPPVIHMGSHYFIDKFDMTPLEHELEHVKCRCLWDGHP